MATINDKIYGKLEWDLNYSEGWSGKIEFESGVWIEFSIWCDDPLDSLIVRQTHSIYEKIRCDKEKIMDFVGKELHQEYNEEHRKEGEKYLNFAEFSRKLYADLTWHAISFDADKTSTIYFHTDLFNTYSPVVNLDENGNLLDLELV